MLIEKSSRVLNLILIMLVLIVFRIWHLTVIQYENKLEESHKPQRKVVVEPARRATIRDRFNVPLAINKVQYRVAILYSQLRSVPAIVWERDANGKKVKVFKRKEYIKSLSHLLADELKLDPERIEDLIHSKASLYYSIPFVIKEDISEREFYRLKMLEREWAGIHVQILPKRTYPKNKVAADIIGFMGAINRQEYEGVIQEIKALEEYIDLHDIGEDPSLPAGISTPGEARMRLHNLKELAYTVNDYVGKTGIEGRFEEDLRGFQGRTSYYSDARGNFLRELPGKKEPVPGKRILLTISAELQEYAEKLLLQNEQVREAEVSQVDAARQALLTKQPWIKGGAIVAMDPNTGEILALASHPRLDPNDFILSGNSEINEQKRANIVRWFESEDYIGQIWDQKRSLERELYDDKNEAIYEEKQKLNWERYLEFILPLQSPVKHALDKINVKSAVELQRALASLLLLSGQENSYRLCGSLYGGGDHVPHKRGVPADVKRKIEERLNQNEEASKKFKVVLDRYFQSIPNDYDKILLIDLCRTAVREDLFTPELLQICGNQSLPFYRDVSAALSVVEPVVRNLSKSIFQQEFFKSWRQKNETEFLKQKRAEEKKLQKYPKPYIDYFDEMEAQLYAEFWKENRWELISAFLNGGSLPNDLKTYTDMLSSWHAEIAQGAHPAVAWRESYNVLKNALNAIPEKIRIAYLKTLRGFNDLSRPLLGSYKHMRKLNGKQLEKHLAAAFYPIYGFGYGRSYAYRQAATQGSLYKLVVAYAALSQRYHELKEKISHIHLGNLNPLEIVDKIYRNDQELFVGYHSNGKPIPQIYKGGRLPKSKMNAIGKLDILHAIETSSNPYFALLAGDVLNSPEDLIRASKLFSFGSKTELELPGEISGKIPTDLSENRTGLYATAIGQHTLVVTPLQTSVMLSAIANGGKILKPTIVYMTADSKEQRAVNGIACPVHFPYKDCLFHVGIDFPLFFTNSQEEHKKKILKMPIHIKREIFMPSIIRSTLLTGMQRVLSRMHHSNLSNLSKLYHNHPEAISDFLDMKDQMVGKTSSAEALETIDLDSQWGTNTYTHVWFGGISFDSQVKDTYLAKDAFGKPELVVVVYLRFGKLGKESAPIAAQMVKKWREIKQQAPF